MLQGAMAAEGKVGLMMNVPRGQLAASARRCCRPCSNRPFPSLADDQWVDVNTIIDESVVRHIIPRLKAAGARGIVEYPLTKIIE